MSLFHPRVITAALEKTASAAIPDRHREILSAWSGSIASGAILKQKETNYDSVFIQNILVEVLGYTDFAPQKTCTLRKNLQIGKGNADVALGTFTLTSSS